MRLRLHRPTGWWSIMIAVALLGLGVRLGYVFIYQYHVHIGGDSYYYHYGANLLANGHGFIQPYDYFQRGWTVQAAEHPPLYIVVLAAESWVGLHTYLEHQILTVLLDTFTIVIIGYTARELFGKAAGIFAAVIVAIYPYFWFNDGGVLSEGTAQLTTALTVLWAYRFWKRRTLKSACLLGIGIALATLSRAEAILLPILMLLPLVLWMKGMPWRRRITLFLASGLTAALVLGPWVGYNISRFEKTTTVSSGFDVTLLSANCPTTYFGPFRGYWAAICVIYKARTYRDLSLMQPLYQKDALDFIKAHKRDVPMLELAREGRTWDWYRPFQNIQLDSTIETKPLNWGRLGLGMLWFMQAASIFGIYVMRKRRIPLTPLFALIINVAISTAITFGQSRYRAAAEEAFVLLTTAAFVGVLDIIKRRRGAAPVEPDTTRSSEGAPVVLDKPGDPDRAAVS